MNSEFWTDSVIRLIPHIMFGYFCSKPVVTATLQYKPTMIKWKIIRRIRAVNKIKCDFSPDNAAVATIIYPLETTMIDHWWRIYQLMAVLIKHRGGDFQFVGPPHHNITYYIVKIKWRTKHNLVKKIGPGGEMIARITSPSP